MNRHSRLVLKGFQSQSNREELYLGLINAFNDATVYKYVDANIDSMIDNFAKKYEIEMMNSDPIIGLSINEQINLLNAEFLVGYDKFIKTQVLGNQEKPNQYVIRDGGPVTSRNGVKHFQQKPNDILSSWKSNSGRGMTTREDVQADTYANNPYYHSSDLSDLSNSSNSSNGGMQTGITICDQRDIGTSNLIDTFYGDANFRLMNGLDKGQKLWGGHFGDATPESDARLLSRRIFRSNEQGIENGIPVYEQRLYRRNLERDASEALSGRERESSIYRHDMKSLYDRVDQRKQWVEKHKVMDQYS